MATIYPTLPRGVFFCDIRWNLTYSINIENIETESEVFWPVSVSILKLKSSIDSTLFAAAVTTSYQRIRNVPSDIVNSSRASKQSILIKFLLEIERASCKIGNHGFFTSVVTQTRAHANTHANTHIMYEVTQFYLLFKAVKPLCTLFSLLYLYVHVCA